MAPRLVVDSFCEFAKVLRPWTVGEFWNVSSHEFVPGVVYLLERQRFVEDGPLLRDQIELGKSRFVFSLPFEGSETLINHLHQYRLADLVKSGKLLVIAGGNMGPEWPHITYDLFLTKFHDFDENIEESQRSTQEIYQKKIKPYKFLFLNGRERPHRKYLVEKFDQLGLLESSIWSFLSPILTPNREINLRSSDGQDLMIRPRSIKLLEEKYEVPRYHNRTITNENRFVKNELFNDEWGDIYVNADAYIDTYFSVVTETVFNYPYSFRTEKIYKPIAMCHPWIAVANCGYYRDMRNLGFKTFERLIDESFDSIDNNQQRIDRIAEIVNNLCHSDLQSFLDAAQEICKYNQQHLLSLRQQVIREFPERFFQFLSRYE